MDAGAVAVVAEAVVAEAVVAEAVVTEAVVDAASNMHDDHQHKKRRVEGE